MGFGLTTKTMYYCSIMGNSGQHFALGVYKGEGGSSIFIKMRSEYRHAGPDPYFFPLAPITVQLSFPIAQRTHTSSYLTLYRNLGYQPPDKKLWPKFQDYTPGSFPWFLTEKDVI